MESIGMGGIVKTFVNLVLIFVVISWESAYSMDSDDLYCIYENSNYQGKELCGADKASWLSLAWFHKISSLKVRPDSELVAFRKTGYWGREKIFSGNNPNLRKWNNRIGSFYTRAVDSEQQSVCFYARENFRGRRLCTTEGRMFLPWFWNNRISSVSIPAGFKVTLYSRWFYKGDTSVLMSSSPDLGDFNNIASSLEIEAVTQTVDSDGDGVNDSSDLCPATMLGEVVNEQGCALSQLDTDLDGVTDDLDQCPMTPVGEPVDSHGCSPSQTDEDGDGVSDAEDRCPNTANGAIVDIDGCSLSQLDSDEDGISDALDQCPLTPVNETVDAIGCGYSQIDTDQDGVSDDIDECPGTGQGHVGDVSGCSDEQIIQMADIVLISPQPSAELSAGKIVVYGTVEWTGELGVTVNGQVASLDTSQVPIAFSLMLDIPEGDSEIEITATNLYGKSTTLVSSVFAGQNSEFKAELLNDLGFAPFTAELQFTTETALRLISVEVDFNGDEIYEINQQAEVGSFVDIDEVFTHVYLNTGHHIIDTRVQDENGQYYQQSLAVHVMQKSRLANQLTGIWTSMNSAIINGDVQLGLESLSTKAAPEYQAVFQALQPNFASIVSEYSPMDCTDTGRTIASCTVVRTNEATGTRTLHYINFGKNQRGLWKIQGL